MENAARPQRAAPEALGQGAFTLWKGHGEGADFTAEGPAIQHAGRTVSPPTGLWMTPPSPHLCGPSTRLPPMHVPGVSFRAQGPGCRWVGAGEGW